MTELKQCQTQRNAPIVQLVKALPKKKKNAQGTPVYLQGMAEGKTVGKHPKTEYISTTYGCVAVCCSVLQDVAAQYTSTTYG